MSTRYRVGEGPSKVFAPWDRSPKPTFGVPKEHVFWDTHTQITSERYPQSPCSATNCAAPRAGFWHKIVFFLLFSESAHLPAPWFKARPPSQGPEAGSGPPWSRKGLLVPVQQLVGTTNDRWRSCRGSAASLCLLRSRNTFTSDARSPETLQSAPTD